MADDGGRVFEVSGAGGDVVRYAEADFDELWKTTDEHEMRRHVGLGWILLDEQVGPGDGPGHPELAARTETTGGGWGLTMRTVAVDAGPDDVTTYLLGHLKA
ncbi:MAG TPA: hypothetical protein VFD50_11235 [Thermoleophilia bacterium]|nr:hypothetical protein [Thermoleophilia bacterium]